MKVLSLIFVHLMLTSSLLFSQVAINTTGTNPDASAILDVSSASEGLLIPRMTQSERDAISDPATGLIIFQTDGMSGLYYNSGNSEVPAWALVGNNAGQWQNNGSKIYYNAGKVGIGTDNPGANLEVRGYSTDNGANIRIGNSDLSHFLLIWSGRENDPNPFIWWKAGDPLRFSTDQGGWSEKMRITSNGQLGIGTQTPDSSALVEMSSFDKGFLVPRMTQAQIEAISAPADGLQVYCTTNGKMYLFVASLGQWKELAFGLGTLIPPFSCGLSITISHVTGLVAPVDKTTTYGTVTDIPGASTKCWITSNLGSDHQATAVDDATEESAGWYWQFNKKQGFKHNGSTVTPAWVYTSISENSNWTADNDPCTIELGSGWRIPTFSEWSSVKTAGSWLNDWTEPWNSALKLHAAGYLNTSGTLLDRGSTGLYVSATQYNNTTCDVIQFNSSFVTTGFLAKANGYSVRCLKD
jgi:hypothetical protein